jgi:hypothetical protein
MIYMEEVDRHVLQIPQATIIDTGGTKPSSLRLRSTASWAEARCAGTRLGGWI